MPQTDSMDALGALAVQMRQHVLKLPFGKRLVYTNSLLFGSRYGWGEEVVGSADCSGGVCFGLWLLGYNIRTNATGLFTMCDVIDTLPEAGDLAFWRKVSIPDTHDPQAVWVSKGMQHVSMFSDHMLVMDSTLEFHDTPISLLQQMYFKENGLPVFARLNREVLKRRSDADKDSWGVDDLLVPLFGAFAEEGI